MTPSDHDLLRLYARDGSQSAFAELVRRHVDLVYSAARRQVRSSALAEEIAQSVFLDLSRHATRLKPDTPLVAWLHVVTRRTAIDAIRRESRRLVREQTALELAAMKPNPSDWTEIEPLLDEVLETLSEPDRAAVLLRYFQNKSLREVGEALGSSEEAAQKRVARAVDRLRTAFARRGIAVGAAGLTTELSAHAIQAAPAALSASISGANVSAAVALLKTTKTVAMTTLQKTLATLAVTAALGFALFEGSAAWRLHRRVQDGQQRLDELAETARQLRIDRDAAARKLADLGRDRSGGRSAAQPGSDAALEQEAAAWFARIEQLKQALVRHPELSIPELQLLTERNWLLASYNKDFSQEKNVLGDLRFLRTVAKQSFIGRVSEAARGYFGATQSLPTQFDQLAPFLRPQIDPKILDRYDFQSGNNRIFIAEKLAGAVDLDDLALCAWENASPGLNGYAGMETADGRMVREAAEAYAAAHGGSRATDAAQLWPFLAQPFDAAALSKLFSGLPLSHRSVPPPAR